MPATIITSRSELIKAQIDVCESIAEALDAMATKDPSAYIRGFADALKGKLKESANAA